MTSSKKMLIALTSVVALGAASPAFAAEKRVDGAFAVTAYRGYGPSPEQQINATPFTAVDFDQIAYLTQVCDEDMKKQRPNAVVEVGTDVVTSVIGAGIGSFVGATAAFGDAIDAGKQATYAGGQVAGMSASSGITNRWRANRYDMGQCVALQVQWAQKIDGQLIGKGIIINAHSVNYRGVKRSGLPAGTPTPSRPAADRANDAAAAAGV